jgi:pilus assembly protein CpaB
MLLAMANRPIDSNTTFSTGGDVSRFQRRTVPGRPTEGISNAMANFGKGIGQALGAPAVTGPVVRVARGNNVTVVPVGAH